MGDMKMALEIMGSASMRSIMRKKDKNAGEAFVVYPYVNGRERGFMVSDSRNTDKNGTGRAVAFSEDRNSDSVVVYVGKEYKHEYEASVEMNFKFDSISDCIKLTEAIYENHAYYAYCKKSVYFSRVGASIAAFLLGKLTEKQLAGHLALIDKEARKN